MQKILVTGAGGYLGAVLVPRLLDRGQTVTAVDTFPFGDVLADHAEHPNLTRVHADIRHMPTDLLAGIDAVVHLAAVSNDPAGELLPSWTSGVNAAATDELARAARSAGVSRFVLASSCGVYGTGDRILTEASPLAPKSTYAESKVAAESALQVVATPGFTTVALRFATLYGVGPRMRFDLAVHAMTRAAAVEREIGVDGDGQQWRPFLHVTDAARACLTALAADADRLTQPVYNVVGENLRVAELAEKVAGEFDDVAVTRRPGAPDARSYHVDGSRFGSDTGFTPGRTVVDGVQEVKAWLEVPGNAAAAETPRYSTAATLAQQLLIPAVQGGQPLREEPLPYALPLLGDAEETEILDTLRSGWLTTGPKTTRFEQQAAEYLGVEHALAVSSCTAALHLALAVHDVGPGDEVITTPITWPATANVIVHTGATPVFADIDPDTLNIDPTAVRAAITPRTRAILPVHMAGQPADMEAITALAAEHGLVVIEDAAHAIGAEYHGRMVGQSSPATCFSFYATKNLSAGEGGMLVLTDPDRAARARRLAAHGISKDAWRRHTGGTSPRWELVEAGWKYNMPDLTAALALHQLTRLDEFIAIRARYADLYSHRFAQVPAVTPLTRVAGVRHAHHLYVIRLDLDRLTIDRDEFMAALKAEGIGTGIHFPALHTQPYYRERGIDPAACPNARAAGEAIVSLPLYPKMSEADVHDAAAAVVKLATAYQR